MGCSCMFNRIWYWGFIIHTIHVWYIYLHLVDFYGKCVGKNTALLEKYFDRDSLSHDCEFFLHAAVPGCLKGTVLDFFFA